MQALVNNNMVRGWDDPRLPTLAGMRRRGLTAEGINTLCHELGINRSEGFVQLKRLYHHVRNHLDSTSPRALAVLRPLKLVCFPNVPPTVLCMYQNTMHISQAGATLRVVLRSASRMSRRVRAKWLCR